MVFMKDASFRSLFNFILSELIFLYIDIICTFSEKKSVDPVFAIYFTTKMSEKYRYVTFLINYVIIKTN